MVAVIKEVLEGGFGAPVLYAQAIGGDGQASAVAADEAVDEDGGLGGGQDGEEFFGVCGGDFFGVQRKVDVGHAGALDELGFAGIVAIAEVDDGFDVTVGQGLKTGRGGLGTAVEGGRDLIEVIDAGLLAAHGGAACEGGEEEEQGEDG